MSIFHLRGKKHLENSVRGIRRAARAGRHHLRRVGGRLRRVFVHRWTEIDIDALITKDDVEVGCHWPEELLHDGFRDPEHLIALHSNIRNQTWAEVHRLVAPGGYRIQKLDTLMQECARDHIGMRIEPKGDPRFRQPERWVSIKARADQYGCRIRGYALRHPQGEIVVPLMNAAGIPSRVIH